MKSPPRIASAISAAMVSFRPLLFIITSQKFRQDRAKGCDTAQTEGQCDPVEQNLPPALVRQVWGQRLLRGICCRRRWSIHVFSLRYMTAHMQAKAHLRGSDQTVRKGDRRATRLRAVPSGLLRQRRQRHAY